MKKRDSGNSMDRRMFLAASGGGLLAAAVPVKALAAVENPSGTPNWPVTGVLGEMATAERSASAPDGKLRKIPIGVFDPVYADLSIDAMLDRVTALGL
ncbi:MAG TPA: hypothetical protein VKF79_01125, partial [Candidatus Acidoferrum sp.]|nr:hypothetical protein [Candidatus Acidoferrum sp.]